MQYSTFVQEFRQIDAKTAFALHTTEGRLLRPDNAPILFVAGEQDKYKFLLRCAYVDATGFLHLVLMANNPVASAPHFYLLLRCIGRSGMCLFEMQVDLCPASTPIAAQQHFYAKLDITPEICAVVDKFSLKLCIGGSSVPFTVWSNDMTGITIADANAELSLNIRDILAAPLSVE